MRLRETLERAAGRPTSPRRPGLRRLGLVTVGLLAYGCASVPRVQDRGEIIRQILPSTVQLRCERSNGGRRAASGIVLASDSTSQRSWVLTTRHFLDPPDAQEVYVRTPGRKDRVKAVVTAVSPDLDLAVLEVGGLALPPVRLKDLVRLGDEVWVLGFPWGRQLTVASGVVSQVGSDDGDSALEGPARMVDVSVSQGASGGGVFDAASGALVGIVEGYRTARVASRDAPTGYVEIPVAGETTVISTELIRRFLVAAGLEGFIAP